MRRGGRKGKLGTLAKTARQAVGGVWRGISLPECGYPQKAVAEELESRRMLATPVGTEFRVNVYTTENQHSVQAAYDGAGNFVTVWTSISQDGSLDGIYARRYDSVGTPLSGEILVNTTTLGRQFAPDVAMNSHGDFVVTWTELPQLIGANYNVYARAYNNQGVAQGNPFIVHFLSSAGDQALSTVAMADSGKFVVCWLDLSTGVQAQLFSKYGVGGEGDPIQVSDTSAGFPDVAMTSDYRMMFTWIDGADIRARVFDVVDGPLGPSVVANSYTTSLQQLPAIATDAEGNFVVVWDGTAGNAVDSLGIHARRFDPTGEPIGEQFLVNTYTTQTQSDASIAMNANGDFVITWASSNQEGSGGSGIYAQQFHADGTKRGPEFHVNTYTSGTQNVPAVALDPSANFVIAWASAQGQDGNLSGVYAQRFSPESPPKIVSSQFVWLTSQHRVEIVFDQDVSSSLQLADLQLACLTDPALDLSGLTAMQWDSSAKRLTYTFPTLPNSGSIPDGQYVATIAAGDVENADGEFMSSDLSLGFFFVSGDASHDGRVDLRDLVLLATHWRQTSNVNYSVGDFDYNGIVNSTDLGILALNWQESLATLAAPLPAEPTAAPAQRAPVRTPTRATSSVIMLVAEPTPTPDPAPVRSAIRAPLR